MASMWRKAMLYLGLGPDEEYDDYDLVDEQPQNHVAARPPARPPAAPPRDAGPTASVRTLPPTIGDDDLHTNGNGNRHDEATATPRRGSRASPRSDAAASSARRPRATVVRPVAKPHVVGPTSFDDAQEVADHFKSNVPVILNLQDVNRDLSRRIIDFASGLCYGLSGQMERVANQVYLLTPTDVEVSAEERRRLHERGYEA